jgi:hypothetical protein
MEDRTSHMDTMAKGKKINSKSSSIKIFDKNNTDNGFQGKLF